MTGFIGGLCPSYSGDSGDAEKCSECRNCRGVLLALPYSGVSIRLPACQALRMSNEQTTDTAIRLIADAMFHARDPDRSSHAFIIQRPGDQFRMSGLGIEINYDETLFTTAVLFVRRHGAPYLGSLSFSDVRSIITNFVADSFYLLTDEVWGRQFDDSFDEHLSPDTFASWANALAHSRLFLEPRELTLFPLSIISCDETFSYPDFFITHPGGLTPNLMGSNARPSDLQPEMFPPFGGSQLPAKPVSSWLGIWAPNVETAARMRATILGAVALLPHQIERYLFSMRTIVPGRCTLKGGSYSVSIGDPHTPAPSENLTLTDADIGWLSDLAELMKSTRKDDRRKMRALEYQYRAWSPEPAKRFPSLVGAIDAVFGGDGAKATQAVIDAVCPLMGAKYDEARIRMLLGLRGSVIHGGAPNVYESSSYRRYYEAYHVDAVRDLELIVAKCLQAEIFGSQFPERPYTYAHVLEERLGKQVRP